MDVRADAALNWQVFAYCLGIAFLAGLAFGVVPALHASRPDLEAVLRESGRSGAAGRRQTRIWNALVISQVGVALVLLVSAGLLLRSFHRLQRVDLGVNAPHVLTFQVTLPAARYETGAKRSAFHRALQERLAALT